MRTGLSLVLALSFWYCHAQNLNLRSFDKELNLYNTLIYRICADNRNLLYLGTSEGLLTFDGFKKSKIPTPSLKDQEVIFIESDKFGNIWGSNLSLEIFSARDSLIKIHQELVGSRENFYFVVSGDNFIILSSKKLDSQFRVFKINPTADSLKLVFEQKFTGKISQLVEIDTTISFVLNVGQKLEKFTYIRHNNDIKFVGTTTLDHHGDYKLGDIIKFLHTEQDTDYVYIRPNLHKFFNGNKSTQGITTVLHDIIKVNGHLYGLTPSGIYNVHTLIHGAESSVSIGMNSSFTDLNNDVWFCGYNGGLYKLQSLNAAYNNFESGAKSDVTSSHFVYPNTLILGNSKGELHVLTLRNNKNIMKKVFNSRITTINTYNQNYIISSDFELVLLDKHFNIISKRQIGSIKDIQVEGDTIWISMSTNFSKLNIKDGLAKKDYLNLLNMRTLSSSIADDRIMVGSKSGVKVVDRANNVRTLKGIDGQYIVKIKRTGPLEFWVFAKDKGIYCVKGDDIVFESKTLADDIFVNALDVVKFQDNFVISIGKGLIMMDTCFNIVKRLYENDGLSINGIQSMYVQGDEIIAINKSGYQVISKEDFKVKRVRPYIYFKNITSLSSKETTRNTEFSKNDNYLQFNFTAIDYTFSEGIQFYYSLEPFDNSYKQTSIPTFTYTNLPPGKYKLNVYAINKAGTKSNIVSTPYITIQNVWYNTTLFFSFVGLISISAPLVVYIMMQKMKNKRLESDRRWRQVVNELSFETLKLQIRPHFILNTLSAIQNLILKEKSADSINAISVFGKMLRSILNKEGSNTSTIKEELDFINSYFEIENLRFRKNLKLTINIDDNHKKEVLNFHIPSLILQPLVENSIIHGFPDEAPKDGEIILVFEYYLDHVTCKVIDNGVGLTDQSTKPKGIGLNNVKSRIEMYNSKFINSTIKHFDIYKSGKFTIAKITIYG